MQVESFNNIVSLIPEKLRNGTSFAEVSDDLFREISKDFEISMKKSTGTLNYIEARSWIELAIFAI